MHHANPSALPTPVELLGIVKAVIERDPVFASLVHGKLYVPSHLNSLFVDLFARLLVVEAWPDITGG